MEIDADDHRRKHGKRRGPGAIGAGLAVFLGMALCLAAAAGAAAGETSLMGVPLKPLSGTFLVFKDVNVRATPQTRGKRLGKLKKGARVQAIGKAEGAWMAVAEDGKPLGFVFAPMLLRLIDGTLEDDLEGEAAAPGVACRYVVRFEGKSPVEEGLFDTSDYEVDYHCERQGTAFAFSTYMFITEAPFQLSANQVYQISIDVTDISAGYDEILSTVFLYRPKRNLVTFDSLSLRDFLEKPETEERPAATVAEALAAAVELAPGTWNDKVWKALIDAGE